MNETIRQETVTTQTTLMQDSQQEIKTQLAQIDSRQRIDHDKLTEINLGMQNLTSELKVLNTSVSDRLSKIEVYQLQNKELNLNELARVSKEDHDLLHDLIVRWRFSRYILVFIGALVGGVVSLIGTLFAISQRFIK